MIDALFVVEKSGNVIIEKQWRKKFERIKVKQEFTKMISQPVYHHENFTSIHILKHGVYFIGITTDEANPLSLFQLVHLIINILHSYLLQISENTIKQHFDIVYELLDEIVDNGSPFITDLNTLKIMIPPPSILNTVINAVSLGTSYGPKTPTPSVSMVYWRHNDIKYTSNEIFLDVNEELDVILNNKGELITADIRGEIVCNSRLSGMPEIKLSFTNPNIFEDEFCSFHPCVRFVQLI
ncbi:AP-3 complex subunit mu-2 [Lobulomyces angularis]|nr:AP-3 complex subunit mu-2 [Lobulomyces angularis]